MDQNKEGQPEKVEIISQKPGKKKPVLLILLLIVLACAVGYLGYTYNSLKKQSEIEKAELERQKVQLEDELVMYL